MAKIRWAENLWFHRGFRYSWCRFHRHCRRLLVLPLCSLLHHVALRLLRDVEVLRAVWCRQRDVYGRLWAHLKFPGRATPDALHICDWPCGLRCRPYVWRTFFLGLQKCSGRRVARQHEVFMSSCRPYLLSPSPLLSMATLYQWTVCLCIISRFRISATTPYL